MTGSGATGGPGGPGPGDGIPAGRRSLLGDADRERLVALLREHYAAGRLDLEDLRRRAGVVLSAADAAEAAAAVADLPPVGAAGEKSRRLSRGRHAEAAEPGPGWIPTHERFRDPSSGTVMRVWTDPADGSRHYVPDEGVPGTG